MDDTLREKALSPGGRGRVVLLVGAVAVAGLAFGTTIVLRSPDRTAERAPGASASNSASPAPGSLDVDLSPGAGTRITDTGVWSGHGSLSGVVTVTNSGESTTVHPLEVVLTVPTEDLHLYNGDDDPWDCAVEDHGMTCTIPDVVEPEESWPELLVLFVEDTTVEGTFTATTSGPGIGEASVEFTIDTSL